MTARAPRANDAAQLQLFACEIVSLGDGSFRAIPRKTQDKLSVKNASKISGWNVATIYRLFAMDMLKGERPSPRKILIYAESLKECQAQMRDQECWTPERREKWRKQTAKKGEKSAPF